MEGIKLKMLVYKHTQTESCTKCIFNLDARTCPRAEDTALLCATEDRKYVNKVSHYFIYTLKGKLSKL